MLCMAHIRRFQWLWSPMSQAFDQIETMDAEANGAVGRAPNGRCFARGGDGARLALRNERNIDGSVSQSCSLANIFALLLRADLRGQVNRAAAAAADCGCPSRFRSRTPSQSGDRIFRAPRPAR